MKVVCNIYVLLHPNRILISYPFLHLGTVHLVISNRCFPNKVVRRWMMLDERSRLEFVGDYLHFAGWKDVEIVDLCARDESGMRITDDQGTVMLRSPYLPDHLDPLWVVRARKETSGIVKE
jgi:hypothetical protein